MRLSLSILVIFQLIFLQQSHHVQSAHSRRRIVFRQERPRYDRSITTFSPDGRLKQVEYGMEATLRGSPVAAIQSEHGICFLVQNSSHGKVHRLDDHMWLVTAGLSGDARFMAKYLREYCQQIRLSYGEPPLASEIARQAADFQHRLTRVGGVRPFGCTAMVLGIDPPQDGSELGTPRLFETDPGGIIEERQFCSAGKGRLRTTKALQSLMEDKQASQASSITELANVMTKAIWKELEDSKKLTSDVWTIVPHADRRGGQKATCYRNVSKEMFSQITENDDQPS